MSKLILTLGAIVALTAIFVIPSAYTLTSKQVAKASTCSASSSTAGNIAGFTSPGGCSSVSGGASGAGLTVANGGGKSSCSAGSATSDHPDSSESTGKSAVSRSSHSP